MKLRQIRHIAQADVWPILQLRRTKFTDGIHRNDFSSTPQIAAPLRPPSCGSSAILVRMTDPQTIQTLWRYMAYADEQILAAAETVPVANDDKDFRISAGSVRKVLTHCYQAQLRWMARMTAVAAPPDVTPTREQLPAMWRASHQTMLDFAAGQTAASLAAIVQSTDRSGAPFALPLGMCMLHVADHATYHRGQLNSLIKLAGGKPSGVMFFGFAKREIET